MTDELSNKPENQTPDTQPEPQPQLQPRTASHKRIAANRANALKSTGPRTRRGKNRSRRNALKHGLLADQILINDGDPNESPQQFNELLSHMLDHFEPADPMERLLVERLAVCYWRLRRAMRYEVSRIRNLRYPSDPLTIGLRNLDPRFDPYTLVLPDQSDINRLRRYSDMIYRDLNQTSRQLELFRAARQAAECEETVPADSLPLKIPAWLEGHQEQV
jgi:hypothetical protein